MFLKIIYVAIFIGFMPSFAKNTVSKKSINLDVPKQILTQYNSETGVVVKLSMTTEKKVLGTSATEKGTLTYLNGKLNLTLNGERKSEMIFDGSKAYLISYPDMELDPNGKRKVILFKTTKQNNLNILLNLFSNPKKFFSHFNVLDKAESGKLLTLTLEDKDKHLKAMTMSFNTEDLVLKKLTYKDDVESEVTIDFSKPNYEATIAKKLFRFKAQKTDEVISQ